MTYTPEQLREEATQLERENCDVMKVDQRTQIALLRAHAAALEEIERLKKERDTAEYKALHREEMFNQRTSLMRDLQRDAMKADARAERAEAALADHEKWLDEMVADYRLDADPHTASKRFSINSLIHEQRAALAECRAKLEVDPRTKYDGIDCRDETIRMLDQKCERLIDVALHKFGVDLSAELKEDKP